MAGRSRRTSDNVQVVKFGGTLPLVLAVPVMTGSFSYSLK